MLLLVGVFLALLFLGMPVAFAIGLAGFVFMLATLLVFGAIAVFSGTFGTLLLRSARAQRWLNRAAGVVFLGLAVRLATISRAAT